MVGVVVSMIVVVLFVFESIVVLLPKESIVVPLPYDFF